MWRHAILTLLTYSMPERTSSPVVPATPTNTPTSRQFRELNNTFSIVGRQQGFTVAAPSYANCTCKKIVCAPCERKAKRNMTLDEYLESEYHGVS